MPLRVALLCLLATACGPSRPEYPKAPVEEVTVTDPAALRRLTERNAKARKLWQTRDKDGASQAILDGEADAAAVLAPRDLPLENLRAVSDRDQIWGEMLLASNHAGHARMLFIKNVKRWAAADPQTAETRARRTEAEIWVKKCDDKLR